jgi:anti-sigma regulatory factor (Ser/Thr protein kinase)
MPDACADGSDVEEACSRLVIPADALSVRRLSGWLTGLLVEAGTEATVLQTRIELAVHEVCMNIVDHAYGPGRVPGPDDLSVDGSVDPDAIRIEVRDHGAGFEFKAAAEPEPGVPHIRGYGLVIVEKLVDELSYARRGDTNIWSLRFDRAPDPQGTRQ